MSLTSRKRHSLRLRSSRRAASRRRAGRHRRAIRIACRSPLRVTLCAARRACRVNGRTGRPHQVEHDLLRAAADCHHAHLRCDPSSSFVVCVILVIVVDAPHGRCARCARPVRSANSWQRGLVSRRRRLVARRPVAAEHLRRLACAELERLRRLHLARAADALRARVLCCVCVCVRVCVCVCFFFSPFVQLHCVCVCWLNFIPRFANSATTVLAYVLPADASIADRRS